MMRQVERASRAQDIISFFSELQSTNAVYLMCCTTVQAVKLVMAELE